MTTSFANGRGSQPAVEKVTPRNPIADEAFFSMQKSHPCIKLDGGEEFTLDGSNVGADSQGSQPVLRFPPTKLSYNATEEEFTLSRTDEDDALYYSDSEEEFTLDDSVVGADSEVSQARIPPTRQSFHEPEEEFTLSRTNDSLVGADSAASQDATSPPTMASYDRNSYDRNSYDRNSYDRNLYDRSANDRIATKAEVEQPPSQTMLPPITDNLLSASFAIPNNVARGTLVTRGEPLVRFHEAGETAPVVEAEPAPSQLQVNVP
jgi:hypothetical protein